MRKIISFIIALIVVIVLTAGALAATTYTEGTLHYIVDGQSVTITGCFGKKTEVYVPADIAGLPVNTVAAGAFADNKYIKTLYLPDTIMTVEAGAVAAGIEVVYNYNISPTPTPTPTLSPSPTEAPQPTVRPTAVPTPTPKPSTSPAPTATPKPSASPIVLPTATPSGEVVVTFSGGASGLVTSQAESKVEADVFLNDEAEDDEAADMSPAEVEALNKEDAEAEASSQTDTELIAPEEKSAAPIVTALAAVSACAAAVTIFVIKGKRKN